MNVRDGKGWATLDTSHYSWQPGVHDIGEALDMTSAAMVLVVLRAADSWEPESEDVMAPDAIICRKGRVLVEYTDGSTQQLGRDALLLPNTRPLMRVTNLSTSIADVLLIARKAD